MPLFDDPMYVAMPAGHALCEARGLSMSDFSSEPWMLATGRTCPDARLFLRACHDAGFEPRIAFQNDDYGAILGFVAAGVGVALVPDMVTRAVRGDVVIRELDPRAAAAADQRDPALRAIARRRPAAMLEVLRGGGRGVGARPAGAGRAHRRRQRLSSAARSAVSV